MMKSVRRVQSQLRGGDFCVLTVFLANEGNLSQVNGPRAKSRPCIQKRGRLSVGSHTQSSVGHVLFLC